MGKRGPQPAPTAMKLVKGERKDRLNVSEPIPDLEEIVAPDWLSEDALVVWDEYAPRLERRKVLTAWDAEAFAGWCDAVVRRRNAVAHLDDEGEVTTQEVFDRSGKNTGSRSVRNPWMLVWKSANEVVQSVGARFGLTPSERSQLNVNVGVGTGAPAEPKRAAAGKARHLSG